MRDIKKVVDFHSFPDYLAPDEEKNKEEYGLKMGKAIEYEWFYRPENGACSFYDKRDKYHNLRLYARGEQSTDLYKKLIIGDKDASTYTNYDWRPLQIIPKFVKLIVNQMTERMFDIRAEAVDNFSTNLKDNYKKYLEDIMISRPIIEEAKNTSGIDIAPDGLEDYPDSQEEIDLHMKLKYKPAIEIAAEEAIKFTLDLNNYKETQGMVLEDVTSIGIGAIKHHTDSGKGIMVEYVDPANMVYSYPLHKNFSDVHYYGEVKRMTIEDVDRISKGKFDKKTLTSIARSTSQWSRYHGNSNDKDNYREDDLSGKMVDILFFTYKTTNTLSYKKKYNKSGGYKMIKKESNFIKPDKNYSGYDSVKKVIDVWYNGALILGTEHIFNYGLCENMIRPNGYLNKTMSNYIVYAPELYQNRTKSAVERIIPYVDEMQQIHIKIQQLIAKARPNGVFIDVNGLDEVDWGDGVKLSPMEVVKIYDETGNVLGTTVDAEGNFNHGKMPIIELQNGVVRGLNELITAYNHYLNLLRDAIGIAQGVDASMPHPDTLVGVQQQVALNSNTATRHILDSVLSMTESLGRAISLRIKDIFKYSNLKEAYINAVGKINVNVLEALKKYHIHDLGINIELKPDTEEKQYLEANIQIALSKELITLDDAIDIRKITNIKLANELLKTRRVRREKAKKEHEKEMIKVQGQTAAENAERVAQAKMQEISAETQSQIAIVNAKTEGKKAEITAEEQAKARLMEQEFSYNIKLRGAEFEVNMGKEKYKEDRKDKRQDKNNTNASKMIEQRSLNSPAQNFESSEDNISGSIEMGEIGPT